MVDRNVFNGIDAVILCGGLGTRLAKVIKGVPKPMAEVASRPFMDILIEYVSTFGFRRFVLCSGHKSRVIEDYYKMHRRDLEIVFSREEESKLAGTGGAVRHAKDIIKSDVFLVMNGDSLCRCDLSNFYRFHMQKAALTSIVLSYSRGEEDVGDVTVNNNQEIISFSEKGFGAQRRYVNAGVYFFTKRVFTFMPERYRFSLEYDVFPRMVNNDFYGYIIKNGFVDIGTPQRYKKAKHSIKN